MRYAYLGPAGTFTEAALLGVEGAREAERVPVSSVPVALAAVVVLIGTVLTQGLLLLQKRISPWSIDVASSVKGAA